MRIISKSIDFRAQDELLQGIAPLSDFLLLDIETTGLSAEHNAVYLIGCIYHQTDGWNLIQWMDNTGNEEKEVLSSFLLFASGYRILVHYNGDRFDIPFLRKRIELHSLADTTVEAQTLDLYKVILPYRRVLGLPDYKQQTMEALLGTGRIGQIMARICKGYGMTVMGWDAFPNKALEEAKSPVDVNYKLKLDGKVYPLDFSDAKFEYNTKEVARFRCHQSHSSLILGSATPDIRSRFFAEQGDYFYHSLPHRFNTKPLPRVQIVDMKEELRAGNRSLFSRSLKDALMDRINRQEQSILFLNRRGTNKLVCCSECGYTYRCPHCSVSMTWHAGQKRLICHYCGSWTTLGSGCPNCGGTLNFIGAGTQLAETELSSCFPGLPILRIDSDTVSPAGSHRILFQRFEVERIPVMIGTQMITKGLNFDRVTLVGVLSADQSLYSSDFRAGERTFSLITQVVGRSGRGKKQGRAVIQTFTPENQTILQAAKQDYEDFYSSEIELRRLQNAPPVVDRYTITASGQTEYAQIVEGKR